MADESGVVVAPAGGVLEKGPKRAPTEAAGSPARLLPENI